MRFSMHEKYHFLGTSADGLITCLCHESSLLEIKCPAKHKDNKVTVLLQIKSIV